MLNYSKLFFENIHGNSAERYVVKENGNIIYYSVIIDGSER